MAGKTEFNSDLFGSEHQQIADENAATDNKSRRTFGSRLKEFTVNRLQPFHPKNRPAIHLIPWWRTTISTNDETENIMVLPPIDDSIADKLMIFRVAKVPMPMPSTTAEEKKAFWKTLISELPAFLDFLVNWTIPAELLCPRFGVKHFHHPDILAALAEMAPQRRLLDIIDMWMACEFNPNGSLITEPRPLVGTAAALEAQLLEHAVTKTSLQNLLHGWHNAMGTYLSRLAKEHPDRVSSSRSGDEGQRVYTVTPPSGCGQKKPA
jgi:hypothetical protein